MKNYFEVDGFIVPFDKVIASHQAHIDYGVHNMRCYYSNDGFVDVSFDDFANYKAWLDSQSNHSEIPTSCSCEKVVDKSFVYNKEVCKVCLWNFPTKGGYYNDKCMACKNYNNFKSTCSEKANDSNNPKNTALQMIKEMQVTKQSNGTEIPQVKWLIECWEAVYGREFDKLTDDDTTVEFLEDFLHDCLGILDYAGALNNINKGDLGNRIPDVGKTMLSRDILQEIVDKVGCI